MASERLRACGDRSSQAIGLTMLSRNAMLRTRSGCRAAQSKASAPPQSWRGYVARRCASDGRRNPAGNVVDTAAAGRHEALVQVALHHQARQKTTRCKKR